MQSDLEAARQDASQHAEEARVSQDRYELEVVQHGKCMESLKNAKNEVHVYCICYTSGSAVLTRELYMYTHIHKFLGSKS